VRQGRTRRQADEIRGPRRRQRYGTAPTGGHPGSGSPASPRAARSRRTTVGRGHRADEPARPPPTARAVRLTPTPSTASGTGTPCTATPGAAETPPPQSPATPPPRAETTAPSPRGRGSFPCRQWIRTTPSSRSSHCTGAVPTSTAPAAPRARCRGADSARPGSPVGRSAHDAERSSPAPSRVSAPTPCSRVSRQRR
jgi:hypothetical protein